MPGRGDPALEDSLSVVDSLTQTLLPPAAFPAERASGPSYLVFMKHLPWLMKS